MAQRTNWPHSGPLGVPVPGKTVPRVFTPPLVVGEAGGCPCGCALTPDTSYGFAVIRFALYVLLEALDPWQQLAVIHAGELLPDGTPRFRYILILVARQNGKTHLLRVLTLYWLFVEAWPIIIGLSTTRAYAKRQLKAVHATAMDHEVLRQELPRGPYRGLRGEVNNEGMTTTIGSEYLVAAPNSKAGRSLSIDRAVIDEIRMHRTRDAWDAITGAMTARLKAQAFCITNQGDDNSSTLNWLYDIASGLINDPDTDTCLLEWSAPPGADMLDPEAHAAANPNLGHRIPYRTIRNLAKNAVLKPFEVDADGRTAEASFRTEYLCQRVPKFNGAIDPASWKECFEAGDLRGVKTVATALDVSPDMQHVTLAGAAVMADGRTRVEAIHAWDGPLALKEARAQLPGMLKTIKPRTFGYVPGGPAASLITDLKKRNWLPAGVLVEEIREEITGVCMGFASRVVGKEIVHADDPLITGHVTSAEKFMIGDRWRFGRKGGHCDAAYAVAVADHLARTQPKSVGKPGLILAPNF